MKQTIYVGSAAAAITAGFAILSTVAQGATVASSLSAPSTGVDDQFYLPTNVEEADAIESTVIPGPPPSNSGGNDQWTYLAADRTSVIQSFSTGSNAGGYILNSVTVQNVMWPTFVDNGTFISVVDGDTFEFRIGTISGSTITPLLTTTATYSGSNVEQFGASGTGTFFTFSLDSGELATLGTLAANTTYFFELAAGAGDPFLELVSTAADGYAGGAAFIGNDGATVDSDLSITAPPGGGDYAFAASLTAIPEPSAVLLGGLGLLALMRRRR